MQINFAIEYFIKIHFKGRRKYLKVTIIAEAGVNHNGSLQLAKKLVEEAAKAGADYVKFQTFRSEKLVTDSAAKADYQKQTTGLQESQLAMLKKLELKGSDFIELKEYCKAAGIGFLSTPFDLDSILFLDGLNMDFWKIPSGEVTDLPYLEEIAHTGKPIVMSTGMCEEREISDAISILRNGNSGEITLLHCNTEYPTPYKDVNLKAMLTLGEHFKVKVGYSDHTKGIEVPIAAAALGAKVIEKHFTLSREMEGPDHRASLEPMELKAMVKAIRHIEQAAGDGIKRVSDSEKKNQTIVRKSIVAKTKIKKGEVYSEENLTVKRPGDGISPMRWKEIIGNTANRDYNVNEQIEW